MELRRRILGETGRAPGITIRCISTTGSCIMRCVLQYHAVPEAPYAAISAIRYVSTGYVMPRTNGYDHQYGAVS
eukprot:3939195-Rhodomonas_salina.1